MGVAPTVVCRQKRTEHGEQVAIAAGAKFHDGQACGRVRNEYMQQAVFARGGLHGEVGAAVCDIDDALPALGAQPECRCDHCGRSLFGSFATTASYESSTAARSSSSGMPPPIRSEFQPDRPIYAITEASCGYLSSHSFATSRLGPHFSPIAWASSEPRNTKILLPTFATTSLSHGSSCHAPGLPRQ